MRLEFRDPARNAARYYEMRLTRTLFGGAALERRWGRIGAAGGMLRIDLFADLPAAKRAHRQLRRAKRARGYRLTRR